MVATSQPLAAQAGLRMLLAGGNAVDAAIATAAVLSVVEPMMAGIGGDVFALVYDARSQAVRALNGSGRAPAASSIGAFEKRGLRQIPGTGILSATVPGAVDAWTTLLDEHGTMSLAEALAPAIAYAEQGFPVSEIIARAWHVEAPRLRAYPDTAHTYLVGGERAPRPGEIFRQPGLARSLRLIAEDGRDAFYRGSLAEAIVRTSEQYDGLLSLEDFATHRSTWDTPISVTYRGHTVYECPPNGQGLTALLALNILSGYDLAALAPGSAEALHLMIEALRLAFADAGAYIADPTMADVPVDALLGEAYTAERRGLIRADRALDTVAAGPAPRGADTSYLTVVDEAGNAVSFIYSIAAHFGSTLVAGDTGICLQNRGIGFRLDPAHRNALAPGKRPFHTIMPCMVLRDGQLWSSFGLVGGLMQPQGHVQMLVNMLDWNMNPQEALDAPRFEIVAPWPNAVALERAIDPAVRGALERIGHQVVPNGIFGFGGGQIIVVDRASGVRMGGSEPRKDGAVVAY
jgi:gamma-glutamyltranspeptidase/glutathione hydrolase